MKKLLLLLILLSTIIYSQQTEKQHIFSGVFALSAEAGATLGFTDYPTLKPEVLGRGSLEYFLPTTSGGIFGIRAFYGAGYVGGKDGYNSDPQYPHIFRTSIRNIGGGFSYTFPVADLIYPFFFLGASYQSFTPRDANSVNLPYAGRSFETNVINYHLETGLKFLLSRHISLNVSAGSEFSSADNWDAVPSSGANDFALYGLGGFSYYIGASVDEDGDGVKDQNDVCPNTPARVVVDEFGCPVDNDGDGVADYLDKCPDTPSGAKVDAEGCPIDTDGDGVPDYLDKCSDTPAKVNVDVKGCPIDTDGDGVADYLDKCNNTPAEVNVDEKGCPVDTDADGVADYLDKCPNTPNGIQVNADGCATVKDTVTVVQTVVLSGDTNFEFNKSKLLSSAYTVLDGLANTMKENPKYKWEIGGHTDAIGSASYNMTLSEQRAQSVLDYLSNKGVDRNTLKIIGYGKDQPIATNETNEGRSMNRRVEIKLLSKE